MDILLIGFLIFVYIGCSAMTYLVMDSDNPLLTCFAALLWPLSIVYFVSYIGVIEPIMNAVKYVKSKKGD